MDKNNIKKIATAVTACGFMCFLFAGNVYYQDDIIRYRPEYSIQIEETTAYQPSAIGILSNLEVVSYEDTSLGYDCEVYDDLFTCIISGYDNLLSIVRYNLVSYEIHNQLVPYDTFNEIMTALVDIRPNTPYQWRYTAEVEIELLNPAGDYYTEYTTTTGAESGPFYPLDISNFHPYRFWSETAQTYYYYIENLVMNLRVAPEGDYPPQQDDTFTLYVTATADEDSTITPAQYTAICHDFMEERGIIVLSPIEDPVQLLWSPISNFLNIEIFPNFKMSTLLLIGFGMLAFGMFMKIFVGG